MISYFSNIIYLLRYLPTCSNWQKVVWQAHVNVTETELLDPSLQPTMARVRPGGTIMGDENERSVGNKGEMRVVYSGTRREEGGGRVEGNNGNGKGQCNGKGQRPGVHF